MGLNDGLRLPPEYDIEHIAQVALFLEHSWVIEFGEAAIGARHRNELVVLDIKELGQTGACSCHSPSTALTLTAFGADESLGYLVLSFHDRFPMCMRFDSHMWGTAPLGRL